MRPLVILGSGDYAQEVLWIVDDINAIEPTWDFLGYIDPAHPEKKGQLHYDRPILGGFDEANRLPHDVYFACGIGKPAYRAKECTAAEQLGWQPATLIHPSTIVARHVEIGEGTIVGAGSILAPSARIGRHVAVVLAVSVGHDAVLGDYCVLSPGARITGHVVLEEQVFIGANATIYPRRRMGAGASLGANSFLLTNLAAGRSAVGIPASPLASPAPSYR